MRCNNCGWDNSPNSQRCEKCNVPLKGSMVEGVKPEPQFNKGVEVDESIKSTIRNGHVELPFIDEPNVVNANTYTPQADKSDLEGVCCEKCKYPLLPGTSVCPKCGFSLKREEAPIPQKEKATPNFRKTVDIYNVINKGCKLIPIQKKGEYSAPQPIFFSDTATLNRSNTEQDNNTITSKEQAELIFNDGKWFIQDKSELMSTFVRSGKITELHRGDIIMLGDRKFEFDVE